MRNLYFFLISLFILGISSSTPAQPSVARKWNEAMIQAIRKDFARPGPHARNLFHVSVAMYDAWAAYDSVAETYLLGKTVHGYSGCGFDRPAPPADIEAARREAISYAAYQVLKHRFRNSPGAQTSLPRFDSLMTALGYNLTFASTDYQSGSPAALGNYIGQCVINYGLQDGSNEQGAYANLFYKPVNPPLIPVQAGNPKIVDLNRWQPLTLEIFIDQNGNIIPGNTPPFMGAEWGHVAPFALKEEDLRIYSRDGQQYWVYHDPGSPPLIELFKAGGINDDYKWNFALVAIWSAQLDPADGVMWDISPGSLGNSAELPTTPQQIREFYDLLEGGTSSRGHAVNPVTGQPYQPQIVPRGDYARVLAEFWADGPNSETPPGHWYSILNYVMDHPQFRKQFKGEGPVLDDLEWDIKAYFALGGALHDAAVTAWGIKGWYDYVRPVSAIRAMADRGQSSDPSQPKYSPAGLPLVPGYIELVKAGDPLAGNTGKNINKIKVRSWRGPTAIRNPDTDVAGVDWVLAENWYPYQRPTFVSPPFAGYISGHSTFSRSAAEVLTLLTGTPYFPGGLGEFPTKKNRFLVFEEGPSMDITLQWATYRDASDQTSLSRIWGGIHPPADDIPGRLLGQVIGPDAFRLAERYFSGLVSDVDPGPAAESPLANIYPNPLAAGTTLVIGLDRPASGMRVDLYNIQGQLLRSLPVHLVRDRQLLQMETNGLATGVYVLRLSGPEWTRGYKFTVRN